MNETTNPTLTFNAFRRLIAQTLMLDEEQVTAEADFLNDLMVDSLRLVDMMLSLEERGYCIPLEEAWQIRTVGDAYRLLCRAVTTPSPAASTGMAVAGL
jgi:acyl carrier protein